ncbi:MULTISPECIES: NAD-dependent epimerase/dehydratase family protein [unclassified Streptomyces]|uniref:NAD-dependent epimerase/dehydratase family protein n=1 Tax=unclassified Streptomyces TaxID=2593676 RepID=UPI001BE5088C|nr:MULTISPECIES: NAD-dependent epimerase/dehydratase family protein [unclassified Streptomyces]MBT2408082.1 NAD-dependent epimerase/dehydratase family protein [Streptomyces sp. ISL-21]MBT2609532.1 NAD-dependent epimerase/dehydratase family protein [Streptomyces sp. ISL-87]
MTHRTPTPTPTPASGGAGGDGLRVVVVGATGNVGTSVVRALVDDPAVGSVLGLARRLPDWRPHKAQWQAMDIEPGGADLVPLFTGADAVIHLAWKFQPTHRPAETWRTNVLGSIRVFEAVAAAGVPALIYASSVGAYSPGPKDRTVDESWPTHGWPQAAYTREKAYLERVLDSYESTHPGIRVVRMRPAFLFKRESASEQRRIFAGRLLPGGLVRPGLIPVVPDLPGLRFQALHTDDAAAAYLAAVTRPVLGAFNLAADPPLDGPALASIFAARPVRLPAAPVRAALAAAWRLRLVPASPDLFDAVLRLPLMDASRAHAELDWQPRHTSVEAIEQFLEGLREHTGMPTAPLAS